MSQMVPNVGRINQFRESVIKSFKRALPDVRDCACQFGRFNLEELETQMLVAPAVRVAVLESCLRFFISIAAPILECVKSLSLYLGSVL